MKGVKADQLRKFMQKKSKAINLRLNPEVLRLLDEALKKDPDHKNRNELIEGLILKYLEEEGKI